MCGSFTSGTGKRSWTQFSQLLRFPDPLPPPMPLDVFPTKPANIVRNDPEGEGNELVLLNFGLVPSWAANPSDVRNLFNVRSETVRKKFGKLFKQRRCVIPTAGFYEWGPKPKGEKYKPKFKLDDGSGSTMLAGVWSSYRRGPPFTFAILTTEPGTDETRAIHHRMPVILDEQQAKLWLDRDADPDELATFTAPRAAPLEIVPIPREEKP